MDWGSELFVEAVSVDERLLSKARVLLKQCDGMTSSLEERNEP